MTPAAPSKKQCPQILSRNFLTPPQKPPLPRNESKNYFLSPADSFSHRICFSAHRSLRRNYFRPSSSASVFRRQQIPLQVSPASVHRRARFLHEPPRSSESRT